MKNYLIEVLLPLRKKARYLSKFISPYPWKQIDLKNDTFIKILPMDD